MKKVYDRVNVLIVLFILGISFGMLLSGCSDDDSGGIGDLFPNVVLSIDSLNFEQVEVRNSAFQTVTVKNLTTDNITVERVTTTNEAFPVGGFLTGGQLIPLELPFTIEPNGARTLYIGFYPTEVQEYLGKVVVESMNAVTSIRETDLVEVKGEGVLELATTPTPTPTPTP